MISYGSKLGALMRQHQCALHPTCSNEKAGLCKVDVGCSGCTFVWWLLGPPPTSWPLTRTMIRLALAKHLTTHKLGRVMPPHTHYHTVLSCNRSTACHNHIFQNGLQLNHSLLVPGARGHSAHSSEPAGGQGALLRVQWRQ